MFFAFILVFYLAKSSFSRQLSPRRLFYEFLQLHCGTALVILVSLSVDIAARLQLLGAVLMLKTVIAFEIFENVLCGGSVTVLNDCCLADWKYDFVECVV